MKLFCPPKWTFYYRYVETTLWERQARSRDARFCYYQFREPDMVSQPALWRPTRFFVCSKSGVTVPYSSTLIVMMIAYTNV